MSDRHPPDTLRRSSDRLRAARRVECDIDVVLQHDPTDPGVQLRCVDVSASGIFVRSAWLLSEGTTILCSFPMEGETTLRIRGRIVRMQNDRVRGHTGMGVAFDELSSAQRARLGRIVRAHGGPVGDTAPHPTVPTEAVAPPVRQQPEERPANDTAPHRAVDPYAIAASVRVAPPAEVARRTDSAPRRRVTIHRETDSPVAGRPVVSGAIVEPPDIPLPSVPAHKLGADPTETIDATAEPDLDIVRRYRQLRARERTLARLREQEHDPSLESTSPDMAIDFAGLRHTPSPPVRATRSARRESTSTRAAGEFDAWPPKKDPSGRR